MTGGIGGILKQSKITDCKSGQRKKTSCPSGCLVHLETTKRNSTKVKNQKQVPWNRDTGLRPTPGKVKQNKARLRPLVPGHGHTTQARSRPALHTVSDLILVVSTSWLYTAFDYFQPSL